MSFLAKHRKLLLVLAGLALFGLCRWPVENHLRTELVKHRLLLPPPGHSALQQMSQSTMMGTLGGLRSLVATFLALDAFGDFSDKNWDELKKKYSIITNLEPRDETHWISVVWHIGVNATASVDMDSSIPAFEKERRFHEYAFEAIRLAENGIKQVPDSVGLRLQFAEIYREKLKDPCKTAEIYKEAMHMPGCPKYITRFYGYFLADCKGNEQSAYDYMIDLFWKGDQHRLPSLIEDLKRLENELNIPYPLRISDDGSQHPGQRSKKRRRKLPGNIVVP